MIKLRGGSRLFFAFCLLISLGFIGCNGSGGDGTEDLLDERRGTRLDGVIDELILVKSDKTQQKSVVASIKKLFSFTKFANAQVPGILVIARQNGVEIDRDTTNSLGQFTLRDLVFGEIELEFIVSGGATFSTTLNIDVTPESIINLVVDIDNTVTPALVTIETFEIFSDSIECEDSQIFNFTSEDVELFVINGGGGDCIEIRDFCNLDIVIGGTIQLVDCEDGVLVRDSGNAFIRSDSPATLTIGANEVGVHTVGNGVANLAGNGVDIFGAITGVQAEAFSSVDIMPIAPGICTIQSEMEPVRILDSATVDTFGCSLVTVLP